MADDPQTAENFNPQPGAPLQYEETPVIEPIPESVNPAPPLPQPAVPTTPPVAKKSGPGYLSTLILLIILFIAGIGLSFFLKQFLPNGINLPTSLSTSPSPTPELVVSPTAPADIYATWKTYPVLSGVTRQPIPGISFKLPPDIAAPICDGGNCASQGTYLPGGTRLTVAPRGVGQLLTVYSGQILTDLSGNAFTMQVASISGLPATDFSGLFTGTTNGGYAFSQMHGMMIQVSPTLSLEINHFTPNGVTADFVSDDTLFNQILNSFLFSAAGNTKGEILPTITVTPSPTVNLTPTPTPTLYPTPTTPPIPAY